MFIGFNDLSVQGQLSHAIIAETLREILRFRQAVKARDASLRVSRTLLDRPAMGGTTFRTLIDAIPSTDAVKRTFLSWLTREGPFLEDEREHSPGTWFEFKGEVVTDTILGEAAHRTLEAAGSSATSNVAVTSLASSDMTEPRLAVERVEDTDRVTIEVDNIIEVAPLVAWLAAREPPIRSWTDLEARARGRCPNLTFAVSAFHALRPQPFHNGCAERLLERLEVLERLLSCFDATGAFTAAGLDLRQMHFEGKKAWFTDSSDAEKVDFKSELTFDHPDRPGEKLFCPWHGKEKSQQFRIHHSYPIAKGQPLYVVYVGPKLTKR